MRGFFDGKRLQSPYKSKGGIHSCVSCRLYKTAISPKIEPYGQGKKGILIIGGAPGEEEDKKGKPWQGAAGRTLQLKLKEFGIDLFRDCVSLNAVNCRPMNKGENRTPTEYEIACCRPRVMAALRQFQPKVVLLLGGLAVTSIIGYKWKKDLGGIAKWRGWAIPDREYQAWLCPTYHPSFLLEQEERNEAEVIWDRDLQQAFNKLKEPFPQWKDEKKCVKILNNVKEVLSHLRGLPFFAFDIEATGLKPYNTAIHQIVAISFCGESEKSYVIPFPTDPGQLRLLKRLLENPRVGKIAANMKYEDTWMNVLHGIQVNPWKFDTMQATHILDNRPKINGLKFQAYVQYGVLGYDDFVKPYIKAEDSNGVNRIMELVKDKKSFEQLMTYCGVDSLLEYRLGMYQMRKLGIVTV